jgi:hypothetical protein
MGGTEFPIRLVANEDIKHTDQDGVGDSDNRALLPSACGQPAEEPCQIGLLGMRGTVGQLHQPRPQRTVPLAGFSRAPFPGTFIIAGRDPGPRGEPRRRPKTTPLNLSEFVDGCS